MSFYCRVSGLTSLWGGFPPPGSKNRTARPRHVGLISCPTSAQAHCTNERFVSGLYHFLRRWRSAFISSFFHSSPEAWVGPLVWCQGLAAFGKPAGLWNPTPTPAPSPGLCEPDRHCPACPPLSGGGCWPGAGGALQSQAHRSIWMLTEDCSNT